TQIGLHPLLTLFSMYFGFQCIGVIGLIIGPIIAVILKAFFRIRNQNKEIEA
ncbi:MAG: AI-2E family transporter, partial [Anaerotignum sp.]|nr:AI-2E family transporter [Anaerotignum sp.]